MAATIRSLMASLLMSMDRAGRACGLSPEGGSISGPRRLLPVPLSDSPGRTSKAAPGTPAGRLRHQNQQAASGDGPAEGKSWLVNLPQEAAPAGAGEELCQYRQRAGRAASGVEGPVDHDGLALEVVLRQEAPV